MGCDIHLAVERRTADGWERAEEMVPRRWREDDEPETERASWYSGRNYSLFAMLAGVRNGSGFAGVDIGDPVVPIDEPRDLPTDVSAEVAAESDIWGVDGHSHSWFSLSELLAVDWSQRIVHRCWARRQRQLRPSRPGETDDQYVERLQEAAQFLGGLPSAEGWGYETCGSSSEGQGPSGWRTIQWSEAWHDSAGTGWWGCIARMARLAEGDLSSVRIVFWFDN